MLPACCGDARHMFYAFVFLSGLETVRTIHRRRRIGEQITLDTLRDIELWIRDYRRKYGCWGHEQRWWASTYFTGNLYALGRLQFQLARFYLPFVIYQHRDTGQVIAISEHGARFRSDGQFDGADGVTDQQAWLTTLQEDRCFVRGHAVADIGAVLSRTIELDAPQWQCILRRGDPILDLHIPATGPLDDEACTRSFEMA
jgi:hypothetical protein